MVKGSCLIGGRGRGRGQDKMDFNNIINNNIGLVDFNGML
jgi:hypothetical protein